LRLKFNWRLCKSRRFYKTHLIQLSTLSYLVVGVRVIAFNATFNNISVISWRSLLLVEETAVPVFGTNKTKRPCIWSFCDTVTENKYYYRLGKNAFNIYVLIFFRRVLRYQRGIIGIRKKNRRKTDNAMTKRKRTKGQTTIYKTLHILNNKPYLYLRCLYSNWRFLDLIVL
jgi:hypothetical protein